MASGFLRVHRLCIEHSHVDVLRAMLNARNSRSMRSAIMLAGMLFCGVCSGSKRRFACVGLAPLVALLLVLPGGAAVVRAQTGSKKPAEVEAPRAVLDAPPPAPPLTEEDERKPPAAPTGAADAKPAKPAARTAAGPSGGKQPGKPAASPEASAAKPAAASGKVQAGAAGSASSPAAVSGKGKAASADVGSRVGAASATAPEGGKGKTAEHAPAAASDGGETAAVEELQQPGQAPPPPPTVDGDFAGPGALTEDTAPQDDFAAEAQEYVRPQKREYSVRIDLLNWLLLGRLSVELEMSVWKYLTVSLTPVFVVAHSPIAINYAGLDDGLTQRSHGIGPLSGVSLGVGAWFWGEPFKGYVVRLEFTNYSYSYRTADAAGPIDRVDFTERRLLLFIGSHSRFGAFTFAGGFGLGYELNQQTRCGLHYDDGSVTSRSDDCKGKQQIALDRSNQERANLNGPLHPVYFQARFSIGVVF